MRWSGAPFLVVLDTHLPWSVKRSISHAPLISVCNSIQILFPDRWQHIIPGVSPTSTIRVSGPASFGCHFSLLCACSADPRAVCWAEEQREDPLGWNARLIAFNELFWRAAVPRASSQIEVTWHHPSKPSAPFIWNAHLCASVCVVSMFMCVFVITEGWADTSNGEKCSAPSQRCTRSFQPLHFDSDILGWMMVWGKPKYLKMNGRKRALDVFSKTKHNLSETLGLPHVSAACHGLNAGVHLPVADRSLRLKASGGFWLSDLVIESNRFSRTVQGC